MKKAPRVFSNTLDASKAAAFYDRMHALKDALEALQAQYTADLAEVVEEASESLSVDLGLFRMAFTAERQKRKREAKIAKMEDYKAVQLDLLGDVAAGSGALPSAPAGRSQRARARTTEAMADHKEFSAELAEAGMISKEAHAETVVIADAIARKFGEPAAPPPKPTMDVTNEIPSFLLRTKPPPQPVT